MAKRILCLWMRNNFRTKSEGLGSYEEQHFLPTFKRMGFGVEVLDWATISDAELIGVVERFDPHYLFVVWYKDRIQPETIRYISNTYEVTTVLWSGDDEHQFNNKTSYATKHIGPYFDRLVSTFPGAEKLYAPREVTVSSFAANEKFFHPRPLKKRFDYSFIGSGYPDRVRWLAEIKPKLPTMVVAGGAWTQFPFLPREDYAKAFNQTKVNLNYGWNRGHLQIKGRDFEVPMSGEFLLTTYNPDLKKHFVFGKEIETYRTNAELVRKAKYYATHDSARERIAIAGLKRSLRDHTYLNRFTKLWKELEA